MAEPDETTDETTGLTSKQLAALEALLAGLTTPEVAKKIGVGRNTVWRWINEPAFAAELRARERGRLNDLSRSLARAGRDAVSVLQEVAEDATAAPAVRVRAADALLGRLLQSHELTLAIDSVDALQERMAAVEEATAQLRRAP